MKLKKFKIDDDCVIALAYRSGWVPIRSIPGVSDPGDDMIALLDRWPVIAASIAQSLEKSEEKLSLLPEAATPVKPFEIRSLRDFMLFEQHVVGAGRGMIRRFMPRFYPWVRLVETLTRRPFKSIRPHPLWYRQPIYYFANHLNVVGEGEVIPWPSYTRSLDYELEVAFVITKALKNPAPQEALDAIGGFMVLNDVSARDVQVPEMRSGMGPQKAKHFINALAEEVATADDVLPHIDNLKGEIRINGKTVAETSTQGMHHSIAQMLQHAAKEEQLHPGEVFATGTLPGGCALENGHWVKSGDQIQMTIERIGTLNNFIAS